MPVALLAGAGGCARARRSSSAGSASACPACTSRCSRSPSRRSSGRSPSSGTPSPAAPTVSSASGRRRSSPTRTHYYAFTLVVVGVGLARSCASPARRSASHCAACAIRRCAPRALGIDVRATQWRGFALAGMFAGLAGGLFAFSKGSISPEIAGDPALGRRARDGAARRAHTLCSVRCSAPPAFTWLRRRAAARDRVLARGRSGVLILRDRACSFPMGIGGALVRAPDSVRARRRV